MNNEYLLLTGALKVFNDFTHSTEGYCIEHDIDNPKYELLKSKYPVVQIAGNGSDFSKAVNLLRWVHDNVLPNNGTRDVEFIPKESISILDYSFGKGHEFGVYCRLQAIVFTECCLSIGLLARTIHCLPFSPNDFESHVVSMAYIRELKKWILFDPGNNAYFLDEHGNALSPLEARQRLADDNIAVNNDLRPNDDQDFDDKAAWYKQYMAKNLFYIKYSSINTFGTDLVENQTTYHLIPKGFNVKDREIAYCEYAIKISSEQLRQDWENNLASFINQEIHAVSPEQFFRSTEFSLITPRLIIREVKTTDDEQMLAAMSCPEIASMHSNGFRSISDVRRYITVLLQEYQNDKYRTLAIADKMTNKLYGSITIDTHKIFPRAEIGYWISMPYRNQGYATEAVRAIIEYGLSTLQLSRIQATHGTDNPASGRVLEKAGMICEGTLRQYGFASDEKMYSITKADM